MINLERAFMAIGLVSASFSTIYRFTEGYSVYSWPLAACLWIITCWIKTERIHALTKNK